jgi:hypothetical protein
MSTVPASVSDGWTTCMDSIYNVLYRLYIGLNGLVMRRCVEICAIQFHGNCVRSVGSVYSISFLGCRRQRSECCCESFVVSVIDAARVVNDSCGRRPTMLAEGNT